jgi:3-hydroxyisobutyrate dehydrogenase
MGAHDGTLAIMVGGSDEAVERCRGPLSLMGSLIEHFGAVGSGTNAKIARNLITFASYAVVGEAQRLAEAAGLDVAKLGEVVRHSDRVTGGPGAVMLRPSAATMADDDGLRPIFEHTATLGGKDLHLAADLGAALGVATPFAELAAAHLRFGLGLDDEPAS